MANTEKTENEYCVINVRPAAKNKFVAATEAYCKKIGLPAGSLKQVDAFEVMVEQWENFQTAVESECVK